MRTISALRRGVVGALRRVDVQRLRAVLDDIAADDDWQTRALVVLRAARPKSMREATDALAMAGLDIRTVKGKEATISARAQRDRINASPKLRALVFERKAKPRGKRR